MNNLNQREQLFKIDVENFTEYAQNLRSQFFDYWSEPNKSKTKMRWELEKTWDTKRRLRTWLTNENKWNANKTINKGKATGAHQLLEELRADFRPE